MRLIAVDLQNEFCIEGGVYFRQRPCVSFLVETVFPFLREQSFQLAEIVSDYRLPRPHGMRDSCVPGEWGYKSIVPRIIKHQNTWIKCMHSPVWIRKKCDNSSGEIGVPFQAPSNFTEWLKGTIGPPEVNSQVALIGLTLDCCVLCTSQELAFRGYQPRIIIEGVDTFSGDLDDKKTFLRTALLNWGSPIEWGEFLNIYNRIKQTG